MKLNTKNLMQKTPGNVFLGHLEEQVFHIFPRLHLIMEGLPPPPPHAPPPLTPFRIFVDHVTIFSSSPMQHLRWSFMTKKR